MFVVGAIASTSAASEIHTPADAARAPSGETETIVELRRVDRLHRGREAAWCVEEDHRGAVAVLRGARDLVRHVVLGDGVDLEVWPEPDREHARLRRARGGA
jgi:hypothetical protein